ncbi:hypothetical protein ABIB40_003355 [Pedobacter sp. UYP30]
MELRHSYFMNTLGEVEDFIAEYFRRNEGIIKNGDSAETSISPNGFCELTFFI